MAARVPHRIKLWVQRLLKEEKSYSEIARICGTSQSYVKAADEETLADIEGSKRHHVWPPVRCDSCGGMLIEVPCVLCLTRRNLTNTRALRNAGLPTPDSTPSKDGSTPSGE